MVAEDETVGGGLARRGSGLDVAADEGGATRRTPLIEESRSTIEYSISLSSIRQSPAIEAEGPTYESVITVFAPTTAGPTIRLPVTFAPGSGSRATG